MASMIDRGGMVDRGLSDFGEILMDFMSETMPGSDNNFFVDVCRMSGEYNVMAQIASACLKQAEAQAQGGVGEALREKVARALASVVEGAVGVGVEEVDRAQVVAAVRGVLSNALEEGSIDVKAMAVSLLEALSLEYKSIDVEKGKFLIYINEKVGETPRWNQQITNIIMGLLNDDSYGQSYLWSRSGYDSEDAPNELEHIEVLCLDKPGTPGTIKLKVTNKGGDYNIVSREDPTGPFKSVVMPGITFNLSISLGEESHPFKVEGFKFNTDTLTDEKKYNFLKVLTESLNIIPDAEMGRHDAACKSFNADLEGLKQCVRSAEAAAAAAKAAAQAAEAAQAQAEVAQAAAEAAAVEAVMPRGIRGGARGKVMEKVLLILTKLKINSVNCDKKLLTLLALGVNHGSKPLLGLGCPEFAGVKLPKTICAALESSLDGEITGKQIWGELKLRVDLQEENLSGGLVTQSANTHGLLMRVKEEYPQSDDDRASSL